MSPRIIRFYLPKQKSLIPGTSFLSLKSVTFSMQNIKIQTFYDKYVDNKVLETSDFLGHFDILKWQDLKKDPNSCKKLQRKPLYKIALITGEATYGSNDHIFQVTGTNIVFINSMTRCSFSTHDPEFYGEYCVFSESFLRGINRLSYYNWPVFSGYDIHVKKLNNNEYQDIHKIVNEIENEYHSLYPFKEQLVLNRILDIIHYVQKLEMNTYSGNIAENSMSDRFLALLTSEFSDISPSNQLRGKSPSYFADLLNVTGDKLNLILKRTTGKTTQELIHERVISEANIMLRYSSYSMKEIAWSLNFQETSHFLNFYKKNTSMTPLTYRGK
ncbi:helix-turn-helix domain-containing protein [Chitinophaga sancti]|uniref:Helix-turn-helix domain-containing protein n=2 Tax=Chitinophaga sancti TaxID=1004 RepID=A0ABZ0XNQ9_9BACT|nr:helix-turn-helix domain-containing protein [Chitinophaga sancti]WQD62119.1 helix-turn-helix domain-containing protein [Chitinophaga sancti]WQG92312.1 helix-turn-helix domain-containing protein [Chitinophaga sancti]